MNEYELYSDESGHPANQIYYLFFGGIFCTSTRASILATAIANFKKKHDIKSELKWKKVSSNYLDKYRELIQIFFNDPHARFSILQIDQSSEEWVNFKIESSSKTKKYHKQEYAFYQFLLKTFVRLSSTKRWWVYHDDGYFRKPDVIKQIEFLFNRTYKKAHGQSTSRIIRLATTKDSKSDDLIQLTDVLINALAYKLLNKTPENSAKQELLNEFTKLWDQYSVTEKGVSKIKTSVFEPTIDYEKLKY